MSAAKIVLITGANKGIGYAGVKAFLQSSRTYHVLLGSRSLERGQEAVAKARKECADSTSTVEVLELDISSDSSIQKAYENVKERHGHLDILVNNAGVWKDVEFLTGAVSLRESFMSMYDVNVAGTHMMTHTFLPLLLHSADPRLIFVTGQGRFEASLRGEVFPRPVTEPRGAWPKKMAMDTVGYRCTKAALNMLMTDYHAKLRDDGVKVWAFTPGFVATELGGATQEQLAALGAGDASNAGLLMRGVAEGKNDADTGKVVGKDGVVVGF